MLWAFGCRMLETVQGRFNIPWHAEIYRSVVVIPCQVYSAEPFALPVGFHRFVFGPEAFEKVKRMFDTNVFDAEVVDDEAKSYGPPFMFP